MEEIEDEDIRKAQEKPKLNKNSTHIMEPSDEEAIEELLVPQTKKPKKPPQDNHDDSIPVSHGKRYRTPRVPKIQEEYGPSLHSDLGKPKALSAKQEVTLAVLEAQLSKIKEDEEELPELRKQWRESQADILTGAPERLPPLREINHKIPLKDNNVNYRYHLPGCPDALKSQLADKIQRYTTTGWWTEANVPQAAPMLCIPKKNNKLCTVINTQKRNKNTIKDVTPFPDQEQIQMDVAPLMSRFE